MNGGVGKPASSISQRPQGMLDPHGIYGTRTAYRVRAARRRRATQSIVVGLAFVAFVFTLVMYKRVPHTTTIGSDWQTHLMTNLVALPAWAEAKDGGTLLVPTESGDLLAVDAQRGTVQQSFATAFPLRTQPLVVGDTAFVPCQDGALYAVAWRSGHLLWSHSTPAAMSTRPAYTRVMLPASTSQAVFQPTPQVTPQVTPHPTDQLPAATPAATVLPGAAPNPVPQTSPTSAAPTQLSGIVITGNDEGLILALTANKGHMLWQRTATGPVGNGLTPTHDAAGRALVLVPLLGGVASRGGLWCLDARTGVPVWKFPQDNKAFAAQLAAPAVDAVGNQNANHVYCVDDSGAVICLDLKTGKKVWKTFAQPLPSAPANAAVLLRAQPLFKPFSWGELLIVGGNDGGVRAYDARTGRSRWVFNAGGEVRCRPQTAQLAAASGGRDIVLIGSDAPSIYALDASTGTLLWKFNTGGAAYAGAFLAGQHVLTITAEGSVESFSLPR